MTSGSERRRRKANARVPEPGVVSDAEWQVGLEFAAADAAQMAAQWAAMSAPERDRYLSMHGDGGACDDGAAYDGGNGGDGSGGSDGSDGDSDGSDGDGGDGEDALDASFRAVESGWLALAADGNAGVTDRELLAIAIAEPGTLGDPDRYGDPRDGITQLRCIDRLVARLASARHAVIAGLCPPDEVQSYRAEAHLVEEIQVATRVGPGIARRDIETARLLAGPFARSRADLALGLISDAHVRVLVFATNTVVDDPETVAPEKRVSREEKLAAVQRRVAAPAHRQTASQFRAAVAAAICVVDPDGEADRHRAAKAARDVTVSRDVDGMGVLVDRDDSASVEALHTELTRQAKLLQAERGGTAAARAGDMGARIGACRADVLKTLVLGQPTTTGTAETVTADTAPDDTITGDGAVSDTGGAGGDSGDGAGEGPEPEPGPGSSLEPPVRVLEGHLVIDLATLRGEADNLCLLDGTPIPAPVGRELARSVRAWRRVVTDPVTGHLLDFGRRVYLPAPLLRFIHARDGQCTAPFCQRPATRCQNDHRVPFPDGPSDTANCGLLCDRHHPLKTEKYVSITDGHADGSMTWNTAWGQQVHTEPRPYLDTPDPPRPAGTNTDDTGPPGEPDETDGTDGTENESHGPLPF
ncbi:MAG TPA: DUF222 domain-containing protein [Candidatus Nanopelagicales bacterium]|jgi:hypothetical protein